MSMPVEANAGGKRHIGVPTLSEEEIGGKVGDAADKDEDDDESEHDRHQNSDDVREDPEDILQAPRLLVVELRERAVRLFEFTREELVARDGIVLLHRPKAEIDDEDEHEEDEARRDERLAVQPRRIAEFQHDVGSQRTDRQKEIGRISHLIAEQELDRHRLAHRSADAEDDRRDDAVLGSGQAHLPHRLVLGAAKRQRTLIVVHGHVFEAVLDERGDRGKDHDAQNDRGKEQPRRRADMKHIFHDGF